jgi:hypothetical protein
MKLFIFLMILFSANLFCQSDPIDSVRIVTYDASGVLNNSVIQGYSSGKWRYMGTVVPIVGIQGLQESLNTKLNIADYVPGGGTPTESFFELDSQGNIRPKGTLISDTFFELDSFGNIRPKP